MDLSRGSRRPPAAGLPPLPGPVRLPSPLEPLADPAFARAGLELFLKRDDLVNPAVPGNKWRKLLPNLRAAHRLGLRRVLTFGGAYSNHVRAVAAACAAWGFESIALIRGEELAGRPRNWSLAGAEAQGMELVFVTRATYRRLRHSLAEPETRRLLTRRFGECLLLPEGGSNGLAARGAAGTAAELAAQLPDLGPRDVVACAVGTGGTLAGLAAGLPPGARALGVAALNAPGHLECEVARLHAEGFGRTFGNWRVDHGHHGGGYGRVPPELEAFARDFEARHGLAPERRYVAKTLRCLQLLAAEGAFAPGTRLTAVVTGPPDPEPEPADAPRPPS
ncbi:1-aminocyclopropane-1-carboxylate deaminase/D-cysteine desulfhydrase [Streptomyces hoynatensis]|uniref:Pyridoxal-phosphate dependent enzyme n=1 Tax=Streptomyces hoynatensis TaxID=1141874 RepID=A0A3A9ZCL8_9ACTN|nr:pyridoxal-phosphate dependent enzyme [Streptomyces hoynatensis]RKN45829.1 pyridoxal-phosphate dependent enzyme [Streptomyces hoynatensis]